MAMQTAQNRHALINALERMVAYLNRFCYEGHVSICMMMLRVGGSMLQFNFIVETKHASDYVSC